MKLKNKITNLFTFFSKNKKKINEESIEKKEEKVVPSKDLLPYIGFSTLKREYRKLIEPGRTIRCLVGFPRTGKSRFVEETFKNLPANCILINVSLSDCNTYRHMWEKIILQIKKQVKIDDEGINNELDSGFSFSNEEILSSPEPFNSPIESVFSYLTEIGKKIILVLDQFECARFLFKGVPTCYALLKKIASDDPNIDCSLVLITKAHLKSVLRNVERQSSPFEDRFAENINYITGFSENDLKSFFNSISSTQKLSPKQINEILYYTGNNPGLLKEFKRVLQKHRQSHKNFEGLEIKALITPELRLKINNIYEKFYKYICGYYYEDLNKKGISNYLSALIPYIYNFSRNSADEQELSDLGLLRKDVNEFYYCISQGFTQYLLTEHNSEFDSYSSLAALDNNLYKLFMIELENLILKFRVYGKSILDIEKAIIQKSGVCDKWEKIEHDFIDNKLIVYNELPDYFKILSIRQKLYFLMNNWKGIFDKYFNDNYEWKDLSNWNKNFVNIIRDERNGVSHFNIPYMKPDVLSKVNECCKQICEIIASKEKDMPKKKNESEYVSLASRFFIEPSEIDDVETPSSDVSVERHVGTLIRESWKDDEDNDRESFKIVSDGLKYKFQIPNSVDKDGNKVFKYQLTNGLPAEFDIKNSATAYKAGFAINVVIDV